MSVKKLNFSLDEHVASLMRQRAAELRMPTSRYLADLVLQDVRRQQDLLAAEGYRLLSADTASFADAALPLAAETWPEWETSLQEDITSVDAKETGSEGAS